MEYMWNFNGIHLYFASNNMYSGTNVRTGRRHAQGGCKIKDDGGLLPEVDMK